MPADSRVNGYSCGLCGISDAYKYAGHNAPYIDLVAAIYWKDKLSQVEDDVTPEQLASFYKKIYGYFYGAPENDNGFWNYLPRVYVSRKDAFVTALGQYVKKRFLKENQL